MLFERLERSLVAFVATLMIIVFGPSAAIAGPPQRGTLIKASSQAVYWYGQDGKRYVFPNEKTYKSWYADFSSVKTVSDVDLGAIMIGGNVTYRPGKMLVKIQSDPKTYAVDLGGALRWVKTEAAASALYGADWNKKVEDVPDAFFVNYRSGADISSAQDYQASAALTGAATIDAELAKRDANYHVTSGPEVFAENLDVPWEIAFLPDGDVLVTERSGHLRRIGQHPANLPIPNVKETAEGGLMGVVLHPDFTSNHLIYLYFTGAADGKNRVVRFRLDEDKLVQDKIIIEGIPSAIYHDGGRIAFGPDKLLYVLTGDATDSDNAQDKTSLAGKVLRLTADGGIPSDNPFGTAIWSWGHRNPQGLAWDNHGQLWTTEHGRSGVTSGLDELNAIVAGKNYGWPTIQGDQTKAGMVTPVRNSGPDVTWAPSGMAYVDGSLFFSGLRGESIYEAVLDANGHVTGEIKTHLKSVYGRLRAVVLGPDGYIYFTTSNRDGRGSPKTGDDKILRIRPADLRAR